MRYHDLFFFWKIIIIIPVIKRRMSPAVMFLAHSLMVHLFQAKNELLYAYFFFFGIWNLTFHFMSFQSSSFLNCQALISGKKIIKLKKASLFFPSACLPHLPSASFCLLQCNGYGRKEGHHKNTPIQIY